MSIHARRFGVFALAVAGWLALGAVAHAQFTLRTFPSAQQRFPVNPYFLVAPGLTQAQYLAQVRAYNRTAATAPPWLSGYNPYPNPIVTTGLGYPPPTPFGPLYNPMGVNPWSPGVTNPYTPVGSSYAPGLTNPYTPVTGGYDPGYSSSPYQDYNSTGSTLRGTADVLRAQGSLWTSAEQARLMREQALQARLDTIRKKFDLDTYIKLNTPTYTELEANRAAITLKRIQENATPGEVSSGRSLNVLLDDLRKFPGKKLAGEAPMVTEEVLTLLSVAGPGSTGSLGIVRDREGGKIIPPWPTILQEIFTPKQLSSMENQVKMLYDQAKESKDGTVDPNLVKELSKSLDKACDDLGKRISEMSTSDYLYGKRFLTDLDLARKALQNGDYKAQNDFQKWARGGPRSAQELADYITKTGIKIAPSTMTDEAAYRAIHTALANLDIQLNAQFASAGPAPEYPKE